MKKLTLLFVALFCASSHAYVVYRTPTGQPLKWASPNVRYVVVKGGAPAIAAAYSAANKWNSVSSLKLDFQFIGPQIRIYYAKFSVNGFPTAYTILYRTPDLEKITGADIFLDARFIQKPYIEDYLLHELGHAIGIDHTPDSTAVMYALLQNPPTLQPDDIAAVQSLYPPVSCRRRVLIRWRR